MSAELARASEREVYSIESTLETRLWPPDRTAAASAAELLYTCFATESRAKHFSLETKKKEREKEKEPLDAAAATLGRVYMCVYTLVVSQWYYFGAASERALLNISNKAWSARAMCIPMWCTYRRANCPLWSRGYFVLGEILSYSREGEFRNCAACGRALVLHASSLCIHLRENTCYGGAESSGVFYVYMRARTRGANKEVQSEERWKYCWRNVCSR